MLRKMRILKRNHLEVGKFQCHNSSPVKIHQRPASFLNGRVGNVERVKKPCRMNITSQLWKVSMWMWPFNLWIGKITVKHWAARSLVSVGTVSWFQRDLSNQVGLFKESREELLHNPDKSKIFFRYSKLFYGKRIANYFFNTGKPHVWTWWNSFGKPTPKSDFFKMGWWIMAGWYVDPRFQIPSLKLT